MICGVVVVGVPLALLEKLFLWTLNRFFRQSSGYSIAMYCGLVPSIVEWPSWTFSLSFYWRSIHAPRHNLDLSTTLIDFEISLEYYCIELLKSEVELREGLQKTIDYFKARTCHLEFQHRCPYVDNVLQCPRVRETAYLKSELPGLHFWSIWKSWDERHSDYSRLCMLYIYISLLSFLSGNSCKLLCKSSAAWCFKNAQALDLRKFSKPTGHNAHHSTEQEDRGRARNLTTHVVIDWVRNFCKKLLIETFFAPNFWDFYTSKLCDWEGVTRGHCIWFVVCQAKIKKRLSYAVVPITKWFFASATRIQRRKEAWQNLTDSCSPLPRSLALVQVFKSGREDRHT